jgi:hypothetical protein
MTRVSIFLLVLFPLASMAQTSTDGIYMLSDRTAICGPIRMMARMDDTSRDLPAVHAQRVRMTLSNRNSIPIVLERVTLHYGGETPSAGAPFESESRVPIGAGQEVVFVKSTTGPNPVTYVELNLVKYADGSSWQPSGGEVCTIVPDPLKK